MTSRSEIVAALECLVKEKPGLTTNELVAALEATGFEIPMNGSGTAMRQKANTVVSRLNGLQQQKKIYSHKRSGKTENYWYHGNSNPNTKLVASLGNYQSFEAAQGAIEDYPDDVDVDDQIDVKAFKSKPTKGLDTDQVKSLIPDSVQAQPPRAPDWDYAQAKSFGLERPEAKKTKPGMVRLTLEVRAEQASLIAGVLRLLATEFATAEVITE
jgi:hypothetical protein